MRAFTRSASPRRQAPNLHLPPHRGFRGLHITRQSYPGLSGTIAEMRRLATERRGDRFLRTVAERATRQVADMRDRDAVARAIDGYIRRRVRYVPDPWDVEYLQDPIVTLTMDRPHGDCDDMAILAASMLEAVGVPAAYTIVAQAGDPPGEYSHVFAEYHDGRRWRPLDPSDPDGFEAAQRKEYPRRRRFALSESGPAGRIRLRGGWQGVRAS